MFKVVWNEKRVLNLFFDVLIICSLILNSILILMLIILENDWDFFIYKKNRFKMNCRK